MLTIVAPMKHELAPLRRALARAPGGAGTGLSSQGGGAPVALRVIGVGGERAAASVKALLAAPDRPFRSGPETLPRLLLLGFAGAVAPDLPAGVLMVPSRYYVARRKDHQPDFLEPDAAMWQQAVAVASVAGLSVSHLDSLTVDHLAATPAAKAAARREYPVGVVNMEDYWVARVAAEAGVPFLSVRVVLDEAQDSLPPYLLGLAGQSWARVLPMALALPWRAPTWVRLGCRMRLAQRRLARFALSFIDSLSGTAAALSPPEGEGQVANLSIGPAADPLVVPGSVGGRRPS